MRRPARVQLLRGGSVLEELKASRREAPGDPQRCDRSLRAKIPEPRADQRRREDTAYGGRVKPTCVEPVADRGTQARDELVAGHAGGQVLGAARARVLGRGESGGAPGGA